MATSLPSSCGCRADTHAKSQPAVRKSRFLYLIRQANRMPIHVVEERRVHRTWNVPLFKLFWRAHVEHHSALRYTRATCLSRGQHPGDRRFSS
eukprot:scaffold7624_cov672-Prasinococcus_capsulatus_cf.AAC.2